VSDDGYWTWTCSGTSSSVSCSANKIEDGICGDSADIEHSSIPATDLCTSGTASIVSGDGVPYTWTCDGVNGGSSVSCEATKAGWVNTGLGFYIMKYEAKIQGNNTGSQTYNSAFVPESRPEGTPWVNINQTQALTECSSLGSGYHLITNTEWTSLARHITNQASNWSNGVVGSGVLSRGYSASINNASDGFTNTLPAPTSGGINDLFNTSANTVGSSGSFSLKRIHNLGNGNTIWDLAGNVYEWNSETCTQGSGTGNWYNSSWVEWSDTNLDDYERPTAGPSPLYVSTHNGGRYQGCTVTGNGLRRGGDWTDGLYSGIFSLRMINTPSNSSSYTGFRCTKS